MSEQLIELKGITRTFSNHAGQVTVLENINFAMCRGEFVAIEGRSGSGKSTLLSIIGLLDKPSSGTYMLCGESVNSLSVFQQSLLRNRHIGWIFQNFNLIGDMTVAENVILPLRYHDQVDKSEYVERAKEVLEKVELADKWENYPDQLSGGQQQRVAIARALVTKPDLLLADEPTGNLDSESADIVFRLLSQLHNQGASIVLITHDPELASRCQHQYYLQDGRFVTQPNIRSQAKIA